MTNCKHENITLDDYDVEWDFDHGHHGMITCPDCWENFNAEQLKEMGYKLVKEDDTDK